MKEKITMKTLTMLLKLRTWSVVAATAILVFAYSLSVYTQVADLVGGPLGVERAAARSRQDHGYFSLAISLDTEAVWIQVDLGKNYPIEEVKLFPDVGNNGWGGKHN
ncbi:MAG: hypothetical protein LBJ00_03240 [Planctomycetaceae bacterium]|jgi:hypothetical protein|nr:hypothetical protein [Planctomycetaceae bacterium]